MNGDSNPAWIHGDPRRWQNWARTVLPSADAGYEQTNLPSHLTEDRLYDLDPSPFTVNRRPSVTRLTSPPSFGSANNLHLPQVTRPFESQSSSRSIAPSAHSSSSISLPNVGQVQHLAGPQLANPGSIARCVVCEGTNGPWRRGPLGVRTLCNSCGHIKNSAQQPTSYDEAVALLEGLRVARLARVKRRHDAHDVGDLLQRLERLPTATIDMARARFPASGHIESNSDYRLPRAPTQRFPPSTSLPETSLQIDQGYLPFSQPPSRRLSPSSSMTSMNERTSVMHPMIRIDPPSGSRLPTFDPDNMASSSNSRLSQLPFGASTSTTLPPFPAHSGPFHLSATRSTSPSRYAFDSYREPQSRSAGLPFTSLDGHSTYGGDLDPQEAPSFARRRSYSSTADHAGARFR